jgi:hypothetical protein
MVEEILTMLTKNPLELDTSGLSLFSAAKNNVICNYEPRDGPFTYKQAARKSGNQTRRGNFRLIIS